ncbi:hypothetical protein B0H12DRAFT_1237159 [Mycena haematopus]|nr:hypothetical protein B0H12DRAFT_1237159 [Mycena haematopus]
MHGEHLPHNHALSGCNVEPDQDEKILRGARLLLAFPEQEDVAVDLVWRQATQCSLFARDKLPNLTSPESKLMHNRLFATLLTATLESTNAMDQIRDLISSEYRRNSTNSISPSSSGSLTENSVHIKAFRHEFVGNNHTLLLKTLDHYKETLATDSTYTFSAAFIQASLTGKTRLMYQATLLRFGFVLNVRENVTDREYTYPPADDELRHHLVDLESLKGITMPMLVKHYRAFLAALFSSARNTLLDLSSDPLSSAGVLSRWCAHLAPGSDTRREFLRRVVKEAEDREQVNLEQEAASLVSTIDKLEIIGSTVPVKILLVIDEAHTLTEHWVQDPTAKAGPTGDPIPRSFLSVMEHVLNSLRAVPIFTIYLSTNSKLEGLAPSDRRHPSNRMQHPEQLIPPFTEFTALDVFVEKQSSEVLEHGVTLNKMCDPALVSSFGRPQWTTLLYAGETSDGPHSPSPRFTDTALKRVIDFAQSKITNCSPDPKEAHIAWLSLRILLDIDIQTDAGNLLNANLVNSYQRIVYSVPKHRLWMHTGAPSEPILAEAAGRLMHRKQDGIINPISVLDDYLARGIIAKGERGEILARLLIILALDRAAVAADHIPTPDLDTRGLRFHRPVRLLDFLRHLFTDSEYDTICQATPLEKKPEDLTLEKAFENAYIHVSHFVLAGDFDIVDCRYLWNLFPRGAALQCRNNQVAIDCVAPIAFASSADQLLGRDDFSAVQIQVKNRESPQDLVVSTSKVRPFPEDSKRPILSLVFEFGAPDQHISVDHVTRATTRSGGRPTSVTYQLTVRGLDAFATGNWHPEHAKHMLSITPPFMDFPRAELPENMDRVYAMHPYFTAKGKTATNIMDVYARTPNISIE